MASLSLGQPATHCPLLHRAKTKPRHSHLHNSACLLPCHRCFVEDITVSTFPTHPIRREAAKQMAPGKKNKGRKSAVKVQSLETPEHEDGVPTSPSLSCHAPSLFSLTQPLWFWRQEKRFSFCTYKMTYQKPHQHGCLHKTWIRTPLTDMLVCKGESSSGLNSRQTTTDN